MQFETSREYPPSNGFAHKIEEAIVEACTDVHVPQDVKVLRVLGIIRELNDTIGQLPSKIYYEQTVQKKLKFFFRR